MSDRAEKKINNLSMSQVYRLASWLDREQVRFREARLTIGKIAEEAKEALGFPITRNNVVRAVGELGIELASRGARQSKGGKTRRVKMIAAVGAMTRAVRALATRTAEMRDGLADLAGRIKGLEARFGLTPTTRSDEISDRGEIPG